MAAPKSALVQCGFLFYNIMFCDIYQEKFGNKERISTIKEVKGSCLARGKLPAAFYICMKIASFPGAIFYTIRCLKSLFFVREVIFIHFVQKKEQGFFNSKGIF